MNVINVKKRKRKKKKKKNEPRKETFKQKKKIRSMIKKRLKKESSQKERKILIIINKKARKVNEQRIRPKIKAVFGKYPNIKLDIKKTPNEKKATKLTKKAIKKGYDTVVAVGGDGTINSVLNGVINKKIKLGIIPLGTGNALSYETGLIKKIELACELIVNGKAKKVDTGNINGRYFLLMAGVGIDAWVLEETEKNPFFKQYLGKFPYLMTSLRAGLFYDQPKVKITVDDKYTTEGYQTVVSNIKYYSLIFSMTPYANMQDGYLDVCVFKSKKFFNNVYIYIAESTRGTHPKRKDIFYHKAKKVKITCDIPVPVHADGEILGNKKSITIRVVPKSVNLILP